MPHVYDEGRVSVHIFNDAREPAARCFDTHDEEMKTLVVVDLFAFLAWSYGQDEAEEFKLPSWQFVIEAIRSCAEHEALLWEAWNDMSNDPIL
jgi:hypothetical protein